MGTMALRGVNKEESNMIEHTRWMAVVVVMMLLCGAAPAQQVQMLESNLGNEAPAFEEGMTPSGLGWGADDHAYPDRFVVYPQDGSELVWVPAGEFMRGSTDDDEDAPRGEKPARRVRITQGFWLAKHAVTNAQYRAFCEATRREFPARSHQGDDHPVVFVSWDDAVAYTEHYGLSLPTEAQWEYAARGPESLKYPWGNEWDGSKLCWGENQGPDGRTFPVGSFPQGASWVGALDMVGNVSEWCADWHHPNYYARSQADDPSGPSEGAIRVLRGGAWNRIASNCRAAARNGFAPDRTRDFLGFRVVRSFR